MANPKLISKREFIRHTEKYLKSAEEGQLIRIAYSSKIEIRITKVKSKTIKFLQGIAKIVAQGDINEPILPGYEQW